MVGVGVPNLLNYGVTAKLTRFLGFGVNAGMIPKVKISLYGDATLSYQEVDAYGRLYPFGGAFFLGAGVGYVTMKGTFADTVDVPDLPQYMIPAQRVAVSSEAEIKEMILTPQLGLFHTYGSGISLGIDVGAQVPIAPSQIKFKTKLPPGIPAEYADPASAKVRSTLEAVGKQIVPTLNLRLGFLL